MKNIPQKIYLQIGEDAEDAESFDDLSDVCWCADKINQNDIEYTLTPVISKEGGQQDIPMEKDNWIKVEDKKPEEDKWVLVFNGYWTGVAKYNEDKNYDPADEDDYREPEWEDETTEYFSPIPTHWQPLPNPPSPKEEKES